MTGILKNMRYFVVKVESGDENEFHPTIAKDEQELMEFMDKGSRELGGTWKLEREIGANEFHTMCGG